MSRYEKIVHENMEKLKDSDKGEHFEKDEIMNLVKSATNPEIYEKIHQDKFTQLLKEIDEDVRIDICFECKVLQTGRSRHCYQCA